MFKKILEKLTGSKNKKSEAPADGDNNQGPPEVRKGEAMTRRLSGGLLRVTMGQRPAAAATQQVATESPLHYDLFSKGRVMHTRVHDAYGRYLLRNSAVADNWHTFGQMLNANRFAYVSNSSFDELPILKAPDTVAAKPLTRTEQLLQQVEEVQAKLRCPEIPLQMALEEPGQPGVYMSLDQSEARCENWLQEIARHRSTPGEVLRRLAESMDSSIRAGVARNPNTPVDLMWRLAHDRNVVVRAALAESADLPFEVLDMLAEDANSFVAVRARETKARVRAANRRAS